MKYKWLNLKENQKLIIFFNGWGMDENVVKHLDCEDYDVLMFYDYNTLEIDFDWDLLNIYSEKNLIAWSMGVMISSYLAPTLALPPGEGSYTAINGTLKPIDAEFGIHPKIYDLTIKGFNEKGRDRFIKSMFDVQPPPAFQVPSPLERNIANQLSELIALKEICKLAPSRLSGTLPLGEGALHYDKILISDNDRIIPTKSQVAFWGIEPNLKGGHCPFFQFEKWSELL